MYTNKNKQITNSTQYRETFLNINDNKLIVQKYITIFQRLEDIQPTGFKPPNIPSKVEASDVNQKSFERMSHVKCRIELRKSKIYLGLSKEKVFVMQWLMSIDTKSLSTYGN